MTFNRKVLGSNLSLPDERSNNDARRKIDLYRVYLVSLQEPTILSLYNYVNLWLKYLFCLLVRKYCIINSRNTDMILIFQIF